MTAKELLQQYKNEREEIARLREQYAELRNIAENTTLNPTAEKVQTSGSYDRLGDVVSKMADISTEILERTDNGIIIMQKVESIIIGIEDITERHVLHDRYVMQLSWKAIEKKYNYSHAGVMKIHSKALSKLDT